MQVRLVGPKGTPSVVITTLLDTGASYSAFDEALATSVGYAVASLPLYTVKTASGASVAMRQINNASIEIEGRRVTAKRILLRKVTATPLLATRDVLVRTEFGIDSSFVYFD